MATTRAHAPAIFFALTVAYGQIAAWFLGPSGCLALLACLGLLLVVCKDRLRGTLAGLTLGVVSCLPMLCKPIKTPSAENRVTLVQVSGTIRRSLPGRVTFDAVDLLDSELRYLSVRAVELPWRNSVELIPGAVVWMRGECALVTRTLNPWSFESWLWRRGFHEECAARYISKPVAHRGLNILHKARWSLRERVEELDPDRRGAMVLLSTALGYRDVLSEPVERAFSRLGLTHLLVVSGYQVSMVFGLVYAILLSLAGKVRAVQSGRGWLTVIALLCAGVYVAFIGAEMSATRALIAATCLCLESLLEGSRRFAQRWGVALLVIELLWPWALCEVGVQLTFAALAGIGIGSVIAGRHTVRAVFIIQLAVWALTSTIVAAWSGTFSWLGLLLNITVAPLWSALNCTVGLVALLLRCLGVWGSEYVWETVVRVNEWVVAALLTLSDSWAGGVDVSGYTRCAVALCLATLSGVLGLEAARRRRDFEVTRLAR